MSNKFGDSTNQIPAANGFQGGHSSGKIDINNPVPYSSVPTQQPINFANNPYNNIG